MHGHLGGVCHVGPFDTMSSPWGRLVSEVFVSHASADDVFVAELRRRLAAQGVAVWVDSRALRGGDGLAPQIEQAIIEAADVVVVISPATVNSEWVSREVEKALAVRRARPGYRVVPVLLPGITTKAGGRARVNSNPRHQRDHRRLYRWRKRGRVVSERDRVAHLNDLVRLLQSSRCDTRFTAWQDSGAAHLRRAGGVHEVRRRSGCASKRQAPPQPNAQVVDLGVRRS